MNICLNFCFRVGLTLQDASTLTMTMVGILNSGLNQSQVPTVFFVASWGGGGGSKDVSNEGSLLRTQPKETCKPSSLALCLEIDHCAFY